MRPLSGFYEFKIYAMVKKKVIVLIVCHEHLPEAVTERYSMKST